MTPSELGEVLRAGSNLCYRMESLPNLYYLSFQHMELTAYEMDPKLLSLFVLDFLRSIYCYGSWIEEYDNIKRLNIKKLILQKIEEEETEKEMLKAGIVLSSGQQQQKKKKKKEKVKEKEEEEKSKKQDDDDDHDGNDDPEKKSRLPKEGPMLNDIALDIMSSIMPIVIANSSIAQTMEILMALTAARAYRTFQNEKKKLSSERIIMYQTTFNKLGNGKSLNDGQILHLCTCYDLMAFDGCSDECKPGQVLLQCIQERRSAASSSGKSGGSRGGSGSGSGERNIKNRKSAQAKAEARQDVYNLLSSMGKECKLTMPEVDVAIPDGRIAIKVIGVEGYAKNDPYHVGIIRNCLSWAALHTRQLKAMRWTPVLIDAEAYRRIATSADRKDQLCRMLKMGEYAEKKDEEEGGGGSRGGGKGGGKGGKRRRNKNKKK